MEFGWTKEQEELHRRMRDVGTEAAALSADERIPALAAAGALGLSVGRSFGGGGHDLVSTAYAYEALGATLDDGGTLLAAGAHLFGVAMTVQRVGTDEQKAKWLPKLANGSVIGTVATTEAAAGSDVANVSSSFVQTGDAFRASGEKRYVTYADRASLFLFVGRLDGARGLTTAIIPASRKGIAVAPPLDTVGLAGARLAPVSFTKVEVSSDDVLGRPGAGMAVFQIAMTFERALVLAFRLGAMQNQLDDAVAFARTRKLGDLPLSQHQAVSHRIARMQQRLESARLSIYRAAWLIDQGKRGQAEAALAKWQLAEAAVESAMDDMRLRGGAGYLANGSQMASLTDAIGGSIHSGTGDVLANIVAAWLGL